MKMKLSDMRNAEEPLLGSLVAETEEGFPDYYYFYRTFFSLLDNELVRTYGEYCYCNKANTKEELLLQFQNDVKSVTLVNDYKYRGLWDTTKLEYNPIDNYSMEETSTIEYTGSENNVNKRSGSSTEELARTGSENVLTEYNGSETSENVKSGSSTEELARTGSESVANTMAGKEKTTDTVNGSETSENVIGEVSKTNTNSVSADDSSTYSPNEQTTDMTGSHTDVETRTFNGRNNVSEKEYTNRTNTEVTSFDERKDSTTTTYNNVTDSATKSFEGRSDNETTTFDNRKDSNTITYNDVTDSGLKSFTDRKDISTITRKGNIGVTTTQQMLQSERDILLFSFWNTVFSDISLELLTYIDDWMEGSTWL